MANRYWVGGTGTWDATSTANWSATSGGAGGASAPTSADDVFLNAASGAGSITAASSYANNFDCTGFVGNLTSTGTTTVYGTNITLSSGMSTTNVDFNVVGVAGCTLISAGKTIKQIYVSNAVLTLGDALNIGTFVTTSGGLNTSTSNYSIAATGTISLQGSLSNNLNGSSISCNILLVTAVTLNTGTSTITITGSASKLAGGGKTYNAIVAPLTNSMTIGTFTCANLTVTGAANATSFLALDGNITVTGTLTITGNNIAPNRVAIVSSANGTARSITPSGTRAVSNANFSDILIVGTALTGTSLGNCLGNTNIIFTTAVARWAKGFGNWSSTAVWASLSGGTTGASVPLPQDTVTFDAASGAVSVAMDTFQVPGIVCTGFTGALNMGAISCQMYGNLTFGSAMTFYSVGVTLQLLSRSAGTVNTAGIVVTNLYIGAAGFAYNYTANNSVDATTLNIYGGTFNAGTANINVGTFSAPLSATVNMGSGTWTLSGTGTVWSALAGTTLNAQTSNIVLSNTSTTARTFAGGGKSYPKLTIGGTTGISILTFTGANTFAEIASTKTVAHTIKFTSGTTTTIAKWSVSGTVGNLVTLGASTTSAATLAYSGVGKVSSNYLNVSYITGSPALTWYVGPNSINSGNNTNIYFSDITSGNNLFFGSNF